MHSAVSTTRSVRAHGRLCSQVRGLRGEGGCGMQEEESDTVRTQKSKSDPIPFGSSAKTQSKALNTQETSETGQLLVSAILEGLEPPPQLRRQEPGNPTGSGSGGPAPVNQRLPPFLSHSRTFQDIRSIIEALLPRPDEDGS